MRSCRDNLFIKLYCPMRVQHQCHETLFRDNLCPETEKMRTLVNGTSLMWILKRKTVSVPLGKSWAPLIVIFAYVVLFAIQYVLVRASQTTSGVYLYNVTVVVALTELAKLIIASVFLLKVFGFHELFNLFRKYWFVPLLYVLPSGLYCISNNLVFFNLQVFDPTTYNVLLQLRIVLTGILFQLIFKRVLSRVQWISLVLLTTGCVVKQLGAGESQTGIHGSLFQLLNIDGALLMAQIVCSCLASVLNELFLKDDTGPIMLNNFCMYLTSVIANVIAIIARSLFHDAIDTSHIKQIFSEPLTVAIIVNGAASGMMIPLFLCYFNSITRVFTVSIEITLMAFICWAVFGTPVNLQTLATIIIVSIATYFYVKNPVRDDSCSVSSQAEGQDEIGKKAIADASNNSTITVCAFTDVYQEGNNEPELIVSKL